MSCIFCIQFFGLFNVFRCESLVCFDSFFCVDCFVVRMINIMCWKIWNARIETVWNRTVLEIAKTHLSQYKIVHTMGVYVSPISVSATKLYLNTGLTFNCVKINYDVTVFPKTLKVGIGWIARKTIEIISSWETIEIISSFKNICIQYIKRSENKTVNCLTYLFVFQPDCVADWEFVPTNFFFQVNEICFQKKKQLPKIPTESTLIRQLS